MQKYKKQINKYYFNHPEVWEKLRDHVVSEQSEFVNKIIKKYIKSKKKAKVLDVGSGAGKHADILVQLGNECMGMDLSPTMVEYSNENYKRQGLEFYLGDMRDPKAYKGVKVDVIICLTSTFNYNISNEEIDITLSNFNSALNENGIVILDIFNPLSRLTGKDFDGKFFPENFDEYRNLGLKYEVNHSLDIRNQILTEHKKIFNIFNNTLLADDTSDHRIIFPQEIEYHLNKTGFNLMHYLGGYSFKAKNIDTDESLLIAKKSN